MSNDAGILAELAALGEAGDAAGVARLAGAVAALETSSPAVRLAVAQAFRKVGDSARAVEWFARILPDERPFDHARTLMARLWQAEEKYAEILAMTREEDPAAISDPLAAARARAMIGLGENREALAFLERVGVHRPLPPVLLEVAAEAALGARQWPEAVRALDQSLAASDEPRLHFRRGLALQHLDRFAEAVESLEAAARAEAFFVRARLAQVRLHQRLEQPEAAVAACRDVLAREPDNVAALEALVIHHLEVLDFDAARAAFAEARARLPARFLPAVLEFLISERRGALRRGLRPFHDGALDHRLTDDVKERIGQAFYLTGRFRAARRLGRALEDRERGRLLLAKTGLMIRGRFDEAGLPANRDGELIRALHDYREGDFAACVRRLEGLPVWPSLKLSIENFTNLARSRRKIASDYYAPASPPGRHGGPLPVIQQLWIGAPLSALETLSIRSFLAAGHEVHLYTYDSAMAAPKGCVVKDAGDILPESLVFAHSGKTGRSKGSLAGFADIFRWKLIHERGGAWADADVICLKPIASPTIVSTELARVRALVIPAITNCFFAAEKGEAAFRRAFEESSARDGADLLWGEIGIHRMAQIVAEDGWGERLADPTDFCPIPHFQIVDAIDGALDVEAVLDQTQCRAVHLYNEVLRVGGIDKNGAFPPDSLITILERKVAENEAGATKAAIAA